MNALSWVGVVALSAAAIAACSSSGSSNTTTANAAVTSSGSTSSGQGGQGQGGMSSATTGSNASTGVTSSTSAGKTTGTGAGGGGPCLKCSDFLIMMGGDPSKLCESSQKVASALVKCVCDKCTECAASCNMMGSPTEACQTCAFKNCQTEFAACQADK